MFRKSQSPKGLHLIYNILVTACLFNAAKTNENGNAQQCTDILVAKPYENLNPKDFFSFRTGLVENAIKECKNTLLTGEDGDFIDAWLLTEYVTTL